MRIIFFMLLMLVLKSNFLFAQNENKFFASLLEIDTLIELKNFSINGEMYYPPIVAKAPLNTIYIAQYDPKFHKKDQIQFVKADISTKEIKYFDIKVKGLKNKILENSTNVSNLIFYKDKIYFNVFNNIYQTDIHSLKSKIIFSTKFSFMKMHLINDEIVLSEVYPRLRSNCVVAKLDLKMLKLSKVVQPNFSYTEFAVFGPNNWIEVSGKNIILANANPYSIYFYNDSLKIVDSIIYNKADWNFKVDSEYISLKNLVIANNPSTIINLFRNNLRTKYSWVTGIHSISDSVLFIRYNKTYSNNYIDIWRKNSDGDWEITTEGVIDKQDKVSILSKRNFYLKHWKSTTHLFTESNFITVYPGIPILPWGKTYDAYNAESSEYIKNNQLKYYLSISKLIL